MADPTLADVQQAIALQSEPSLSDVRAAIAASSQSQPDTRSVSDAYKADGIIGAIKQVGKNAKSLSNFSPSNEQMMNAAKHPVTGMEDPAYVYGAGLVSETSLPKALASAFKAGKAKITGLLSSEEGLHPIIEASEEVSPLSPFKQDIFPMRASREGMAPTMREQMASIVDPKNPATLAETPIPEGMKQVFDPFTKKTRLIPIKAAEAAPEAAPVASEAAQHSGGVKDLLHHFIPSSPSAAGAAAGAYAAHKADLPEWAGALVGAAGAKGGTLAVKAFLKTSQGLLPIMESGAPALNAAARAAIAKHKFSQSESENK